MRNPKTVIGLVALGIILIALGFLIGQMVPTIGRVRWEMSLTPTPEPLAPGNVQAVTPDPSLPTPEPMLRTGMTGQNVKDLQSRLFTLGYYKAEIDGQYGVGTREAVIAFQQQNDLDADGVVGAATRKVLFSPEAKPYREPEATGTTEPPAE